MKKTLEYIIIITLIIIIFITTFKLKGMQEYKLVIKKALSKFPKAIVENAERIYRLETAHFTSGQFLRSLSPGMEKTSNIYPYGWQSLNIAIWSKQPEYKPTGFVAGKENGTGITKYFLKFPTFEAGFFTICTFLSLHKNNAGRWFSLDSKLQAGYNAKIANIKPVLTNENIA